LRNSGSFSRSITLSASSKTALFWGSVKGWWGSREGGGVSVGGWELTEQGEEKGLWEPLYRIINEAN
jgi:hypothetical protein